MEVRYFDCPCCGLPTITDPGGYDICSVCWWEDDGQNDDTADQIWGGPNGQYSLKAARANFEAHGHMYNRGKGIEVVENPTQERLALLRYVFAVNDGAELEMPRLLHLLERQRSSS